MQERIRIKEAIVVEGRDDEAVVNQAYDTLIITTHGFGITKETWKLIDKAYHEKGLIILTDPDFSGEEIRRKISTKYPDAKQAYMPLAQATKDGDIGIENASPEDVVIAISKAHAITQEQQDTPVTMRDLILLGLSQNSDATARREAVAAELGIGYGNTKKFLKKINAFGISIEMLREAVERIEKE